MAKEIKMPLPSAADLFSTQEERDNESREYVREIPLEEISDFPNHPFKVKMDEGFEDAWADYLKFCKLSASDFFTNMIREVGLMSPFEPGCMKNIVEKLEKYVK